MPEAVCRGGKTNGLITADGERGGSSSALLLPGVLGGGDEVVDGMLPGTIDGVTTIFTGAEIKPEAILGTPAVFDAVFA